MMPYTSSCLQSVNDSIENAEQGRSRLCKEILDLPGMSSAKVRHFLNNLCSRFPNYNYLEVGCYKGSTLISASYGNSTKPIAIENWSEFDGPRKIFFDNINKWIPENRLTFIERNFTDIAPIEISGPHGKIAIYFYDGSHDVVSQIQAFIHFNPIFHDLFIAVVDDWNMDGVREGTCKAFETLKYTIIEKWELPAAFNGDISQWWNGLGVFLIRK